MSKSTYLGFGIVALNALLTSACSNSDGGAGTGGGTGMTQATGTGGTASGATATIGGTSASIGGSSASIGGTSASIGGSSASIGGSSASIGGATAITGGSVGVGGVNANGGVGGVTSLGGVSATGGAAASGGAPDAGGMLTEPNCNDIPSLAMGDASFKVSSDAFAWCAPIPAENTCDQKMFSEGSSFPIAWTPGPTGTSSYAVVFKDLSVLARTPSTAPTYNRGYHWVMWNIPTSVRALPEDMAGGYASTDVPGARQWGPFNDYAFFAPCPNFDPAAEPIYDDSYAVVVYALPVAAAEIAAPTAGISVVRQMDDYFKSKALAIAEYRGTSNAHASTFPDGGPSPAQTHPCPTDGTTLEGCLP